MAQPQTYTLKRASEIAPAFPATPPNFIGPQYGMFPFPHDYVKPHFKNAKFGDDGNEISMTMLIQAKYLHDAIYYILGYAKKNTVGGSGSGSAHTRPLDRILPMRIPMDSVYNISHWGMVARDITGIRLIGDTGKAGPLAPAGYETFNSGGRLHQTDPNTSPLEDLIERDDPIRRHWYAEIDITFWHPFYRIQDDATTDSDPLGERGRYTYATLIGGLEYASLPTGIIKWGPDAKGVINGEPFDNTGKDAREATGGAGQIVPTGSLVVKWFKVPRDVVGDLISIWVDFANSTVNESAISFYVFDKLISFEPETLLFIPPQNPPDPKFFPTGELFYDIEYTFMIRGNTWNKMLHASGNYYSIFRNNGDKLYDTLDFSVLFNPY